MEEKKERRYTRKTVAEKNPKITELRNSFKSVDKILDAYTEMFDDETAYNLGMDIVRKVILKDN